MTTRLILCALWCVVLLSCSGDKAKDLLEQGNRKLVLDLGGVTYINSSGIGALVGLHSMYQKSAGKIKLCNVAKGVENVFVITKLTSVFDVEDDRDAAVKSFKG